MVEMCCSGARASSYCTCNMESVWCWQIRHGAQLQQHSVKQSCGLQNITGLTYAPDDNLWTVDGGCSNLTQLDNVTFTLGQHRFLLRPDQYVLQVRPPYPMLLPGPLPDSGGPLGGAPHLSGSPAHCPMRLSPCAGSGS